MRLYPVLRSVAVAVGAASFSFSAYAASSFCWNNVEHRLCGDQGKAVHNIRTVSKATKQKVIDRFVEENMASAPGISLGAAPGYGASWGQAFFAVGGISRGADNDNIDGSLAMGIGFGNANKNIGLEVDLGVISLNTADKGFAKDGNWAVKLHRNLPGMFGVAVGAENLAPWGDARDHKTSYYGAVSKVVLLRPYSSNMMPLTISAGVGNNRFLSPEKFSEKASGVGVFGAVAWAFLPQISVIADYTSTMINAGFSFVPVRSLPVTVTVGAVDLTHKQSKKFRAVVSAGYVVSF